MAAPTPHELAARIIVGVGIAFLEAAGADDDEAIRRLMDPPVPLKGAAEIARARLGLDAATCRRIAARKADAVDGRSFVAADGVYLELRDGPDVARLAVRDLGARYRVEPGCELPLVTRLRARFPSRKHVAVGGNPPPS